MSEIGDRDDLRMSMSSIFGVEFWRWRSREYD